MTSRDDAFAWERTARQAQSVGQNLLGSAELRLVGRDGAVYAAPDLVLHYVEHHNYLPPHEFVEAVMLSPP